MGRGFMIKLTSSTLLTCLSLFVQPAAANKPITFVVPYAPGGASDQITRVVAERAAKELGRSIIVDNKPGAAGIVAAQHVAKEKKDGSVFLVGSNAPIVINEALYAKLPYSPREDFLPVVGLGKTPLILVGGKSSNAKNVQELIDWAKKNEPVAMGSGGNGNITHLGGVYAAKALGFSVNHIPFNGTSPGIVNLIGGNIDIMFDTLPSSLAQVQSGNLKPYAMMDESRWPSLPEVPTLAELGYPNLVASAWFGLMAAQGMPSELIEEMNRAVNIAHQDPVVKERLIGLGAVPMPGSTQEFGQFIEREREQWLPVVKETGVTAD